MSSDIPAYILVALLLAGAFAVLGGGAYAIYAGGLLYAAAKLLERGAWDAALRVTALLPGSALGRDALRIAALSAKGAQPEALQAADALLEKVERKPGMRKLLRLTLINHAVDARICAGRYRAALALVDQVDPERRRAAPHGIGIVLDINAAEALYNLGRWDEAAARLDAIQPRAEKRPLHRRWCAIQRAWILAHRGQPRDALALLDPIELRQIDRVYQPEFLFTRAAALSAAGDHAQAEQAAQEGGRLAMRASSQRNALFLLGRIYAAQGRWADADAQLREGAAHPYRGQGGDGLLAWGECLERLGRREDAIAAWKLAIERDPESASAGAALLRLDGLSATDRSALTP